MGSNPAHIHDTRRIVQSRDEAMAVAADIKDGAVAANDASSRKVALELRVVAPRRFFHGSDPNLERAAYIRVAPTRRIKHGPTEETHRAHN